MKRITNSVRLTVFRWCSFIAKALGVLAISSASYAVDLPKENLIHFGSSSNSNLKTIEIADPSCATCQIIHYQYFDFSGQPKDAKQPLAILPVALPSYPQSRNIITNIYCASDPAKAWISALTDSEYRDSISKHTPESCAVHLPKLDQNYAFYLHTGAKGTPFFLEAADF